LVDGHAVFTHVSGRVRAECTPAETEATGAVGLDELRRAFRTASVGVLRHVPLDEGRPDDAAC
jgi:hypothetical protein